jgi:hypothetical protein
MRDNPPVTTRDHTHIIETESRRIVASLLPADRFLERDQTERDYGIDLTVECFDHGEPSGAILLLQVKGTDGEPPREEQQGIPFDISVERLKRAERFATPVLLVWCPVQASEPCCWFLWLQSYISVVLDYEQPGWRGQRTIRLQIPTDNRLPNERRFDRLRFIADHPARAAAMGQLARIVHEAPFLLDDLAKLRRCFVEALALDPIYANAGWRWGVEQRRVVECGLKACDLAIAGEVPNDAELQEAGWILARPGSLYLPGGPPHGQDLDEPARHRMLLHAAEHCARMLSNTVAVYFDERLRNTMWKAEGDHDF